MTVVTVCDSKLANDFTPQKTSASNKNDRMNYKPIGSEPYTKPKAITKPNKTVISNSIVDTYSYLVEPPSL